jgi:para-aminobenzoate synthetase/4-amino-4-deoxychorismate lyase
MDRASFIDRALRVQEFIRAGDTYQVNLTFPMEGRGVIDYDALLEAQQARYCARIDLGSHEILSFSPELFFERTGTRLATKPMKGTAPRGRWQAEDEEVAAALARSPKERAENVMIVDMLRNDVGRVALPGTVHVPLLFTTERYPTLWQMTSTVEGTIAADTTLADIFRALFPCGSVTGAPKIRTMEIIAELEQRPRGIYTGAIGLVRPGGDCIFNVAIRTIVVDKRTGSWSMGIGAGVTADSDPNAEYQESLLKAAFVGRTFTVRQEFQLLETMRLEGGIIHRRERHLRRMRESATYFGFDWDEGPVVAALDAAAAEHPTGLWRCRLVVARAGSLAVTCTPHEDEQRVWKIALAVSPIDSRDPFLFNKTTRRGVFDAARASRPDVDDVLLWNERGELTESTIANLVVERDGVRLTPPVTSGLLGGILREELLEQGAIREQVLTRDDLPRATRIWLINSLRGWIEATLT